MCMVIPAFSELSQFSRKEIIQTLKFSSIGHPRWGIGAPYTFVGLPGEPLSSPRRVHRNADSLDAGAVMAVSVS